MRRKNAIRRAAGTVLRYFVGLTAAALCLWCLGDNLLPVLREHGEDWLLYAAGMRPYAAEGTPEPVPTAPPAADRSLLYALDGVLPLRAEAVPVSTPDPARETGNVEILQMSPGKAVDCFTVKDESGSGLDLAAELKADPNLTVRRDGSPVVLFYSTHTTESYILEGDGSWYYTDDDFRTRDPEKSVVSVAAEAAAVIEAGGFGVVHDTTVHDDPAYSGSYSRSMETLQKNLAAYPTLQITVDVHRDAFGENGATRYKPAAEINGKKAAQIMILTGCDLSADPLFPDWRENLHLALRLQQKGETLFPGLWRPLYFCQRNYNMHATHGSLLVEVGTDVNTLEEAQYAGRLLGETILAVLNDLAE